MDSLEQIGGKVARALQEQVPIAAFPVLAVLLLMVFPDELVRMLVGGAVVIYSFAALDSTQASAVLVVYLAGILYLQYTAKEDLRWRP